MSVPSPSEIRSLNAKSGLSDLVGVFFGGTSGIGEQTAKAFVRYTNNPTVYIIGRNKDAGARILRELGELKPDSKTNFHFMQHDVSLLSEVDAVVKRIVASESKVNLLMLSTNNLNLKSTRSETKEGLDTRLALMYYSRWRAVSTLQPLLETAARIGEPARVASVLSPGARGYKVNLDDLDLKHTYSFLNANYHGFQFNSLAAKRFARLHPDVSYVHSYPGFVRSDIGRELPWFIRPVFTVVVTIAGISAEESGERHFYLGAAGKQFAKGAHLVGAKLEDLSEENEAQGLLAEELQDTLWEHTEEMFRTAAGARSL